MDIECVKCKAKCVPSHEEEGPSTRNGRARDGAGRRVFASGTPKRYKIYVCPICHKTRGLEPQVWL